MQSIEKRLQAYSPFFGEWTLGENVELLGRGQSSYVFTIHSGPRTAALKVISIPMDEATLKRMRDRFSEEQIRKQLQRDYEYARYEIRTMDRLNGTSNIVYFENSAVFEREDTYGWDVLIRMEKLIPFGKYMNSLGGRRTTKLILRIWDDLLEGLKECQSEGIVHLDIKPQNIFYSPDTDYFKLGDFSEAKQSRNGELVAVNAKFGTRGYIPPEIEAKKGGDGRADLYSLALVIYSLLNHDCLPFCSKGSDMGAQIERADQMRWNGQTIPAIRGLDPKVMAILSRCLEYDPDRRYRSATEVQRALHAVMVGGMEDRGPGWKKALPIALGAAASVALIAGGAFFGINALRGNDDAVMMNAPTQAVEQRTEATSTPKPKATEVPEEVFAVTSAKVENGRAIIKGIISDGTLSVHIGPAQDSDADVKVEEGIFRISCEYKEGAEYTLLFKPTGGIPETIKLGKIPPES